MKISKPIIIDGEEFVTTRNTNEQRKGKWLDGCQYGMSGTYWYRYCSECGYTREDDNIDKDSNYCPNCGAIMDSCENASEITRKSNANQWIPCEERLPEVGGDYLVRPSDGVLEDYSDFSEVMIMPYDADCEAFGWWTDRYDHITLGFVDSDFNEFEVLAWMPLPKAYEGRTE